MNAAPAPQVIFLVTVDGDLRVGTGAQAAAAIQAMRAVHARLGLVGHTTWYINEIDFDWTGQHSEALLALAATGEALGVHDHFDTHNAETYSEALILCGASLTRLAKFLAHTERPVALTCHRNGCSLQLEPAYRALRALGYTCLSDVRPGLAWHARMVRDQSEPSSWRCLGSEDPGALFTDNRAVPLGATPWRHDTHNWLDYTSRAGPFLQVPVTCAPWVERDWVRAAVEGQPGTAFIVLDTHPYDLQDPHSGVVCPQRVAEYEAGLAWVLASYNPVLIRMTDVVGYLTEVQAARPA